MDSDLAFSGAYLLTQFLGFAAGLAVSLVLLQLIRGSWRVEEQRLPSLLLASSLLVWNCGGAVSTALMIGGHTLHSSKVQLACRIGYGGLLMFAPAMLSAWRISHRSDLLKRVYSVLIGLAVAAGLLIGTQFWSTLFSGSPLSSGFELRFVAFGSFYTFMAIAIAIRLCEPRSSMVNFCIWLSVISGGASVCAVSLLDHPGLLPNSRLSLLFISEHAVLLPALASFLLLARFRLSDVLVARSLCILAALALSFLTCLLVLGRLPRWTASVAGFPDAAAAALMVMVVAGLLIGFPRLEDAIGAGVLRWLFHQPDFNAELSRFACSIASITEEAVLFRQMEHSVTRIFDHTRAYVIPNDAATAAAIGKDPLAADLIEVASLPHPLARLEDTKPDLYVAIQANGRVDHLLVIAVDFHGRSFLHNELAFFRSLAALTGARRDALAAESARLEIHRREMNLRQQATSAELQALRAQVNPHFLFNALNTIADLVIVDPRKAERAIEMLAETFRYVLMNQNRHMVSVSEELDFIRQYLAIEQVRFGERLTVQIEVDPAVRRRTIPALILQPLVENAIKHGLAPKIGPGLLTIQVRETDDCLRLSVEDNGDGPLVPRRPLKSTGTGLRNTSERLQTIYQGDARLTMETVESQGCRVTILIPQRGLQEAA
jgi:two-component system LytT family sensor kinase